MKSKIIGLTGQTGAGKSTVAEFARELSCEIINADLVAREALQKGSSCLKKLADIFGYDIIDSNGECKRAVLARKAFSSRENTDQLNKITHPWIMRRISEYIEMYGDDKIIILDAPQLFESGGNKICDKVIVVVADENVRLQRITERDGLSYEDAVLRIRAQHDENYYTSRADFVINGMSDIDSVRKQTENIINSLLLKEV